MQPGRKPRKRARPDPIGKGSTDSPAKRARRSEEKKDAAEGKQSDPVRIPLSQTTTSGALYKHGFMQLPPSEAAVATRIPPAPLHAFPQRHEHTLATLRPVVTKPLAAFLLDHPALSEDTPHNILRLVYSPMLMLRAAKLLNDTTATRKEIQAARIVEATTAAQLDSAVHDTFHPITPETPQLLVAPSVRHQRSVRVIDPDIGSIQLPGIQPSATASTGTAKEQKRHHFVNAREQALLAYYTHDPEPDPELEYGLRPNEYPTLTALLNEHRHDWEERDVRLRDAASQIPRISIETVTRSYRQLYRSPMAAFAQSEQRRPCCRGAECRVHNLARKIGRPGMGYNPPEFLTPTEERAWLRRRVLNAPLQDELPAGPCIECVDYNVTMRVLVFQRSLAAPPQPINKTQVKVEEGEYARDVLIPVELNGRRTGVEGHVPVYDEAYRQFGYDTFGPNRVELPVLVEVNTDFYLSLDQMNAGCWGVRKSRPLASVTGERWISLPHPALLKRDPTAWVAAASVPEGDVPMYMWSFYVRTLPLPLLVDRALVLRHVDAVYHTAEPGVVFPSTIPAVWLRHALLSHPLDDPRRPAPMGRRRNPLTAPVVAGLHHRLAPSTRFALARVFKPTLLAENDIETTAVLTSVCALLAHTVFTTFERSVAHVLRFSPDEPLLCGPLELFFESEQYGDWAQHAFFNTASRLRRPDAWSPRLPGARQGPNDRTWVIWTTCVWRVAVALLFSRVVQPWWAEFSVEQHRAFDYNIHKFIVAHVDFFVLFEALGAAAPDVGSDSWLMRMGTDGATEPRLSRVYPQCTRILCAEELPDETPLLHSTNPFFDMPSKKTHASQHIKLAHVILKVRGSNCETRGIESVFDKAMSTYPAIARYIIQTIRCVLSGSYPHATGRPDLPSLIRIAAALGPRTAFLDNVTPEIETAHLKQVRAWIHRHPLLTRNILREHYAYTTEASGIYDDLFAQTKNWILLKAVMRQCNTQIRRAVNVLLLNKPPSLVDTPQSDEGSDVRFYALGEAPGSTADDWNTQEADSARDGNESHAPLSWATLEYRPGRTSFGEIQKWHELQKRFNSKLFKARELVLLARKMKPVERYVPIDMDAAREFMEADGRLESMRIIAYLIAHQVHVPLEEDACLRPAFPTGLLKVLGMTREAHAELRAWLHTSVEYHSPDDSFTKLAYFMCKRNWRDFVLLKTMLALIERNSEYVIGFASAEHSRNSWMAQRTSIGVPWQTASPPRLGYKYFCQGCAKWSHPVIGTAQRSLEQVQKNSLRRTRQRRPSAAAAAPLVESGMVHVKQKLEERKQQIVQQRKNKQPERPFAPRPMHLTNGRGVSFSAIMYNPLTTELYCNHTLMKKRQADLDALEEVAGKHSEHSHSSNDEGEGDDEDDADSATFFAQLGFSKHSGVADLVDTLLPGDVCGRNPLRPVDLIGVYKRVDKLLYSLCVYCGALCEAITANMTNNGLSCGEHALVHEYPKSHPLWRQIKYPAETESALGHSKGASKHHIPRPCFQCGHYDLKGTTTLPVFDVNYRLGEITLCRFHISLVRPVLPRKMLGEQLVPMPLTLVRLQLAKEL